MKKLLLAVVLALVVATASQAAILSVAPAAVTAASGANFVLKLIVTNSPAVDTLDMLITFDPTKVMVLGNAVYGNFMGQQLDDPVYPETALAFQLKNNVTGVFSYTLSGLGPYTSEGSGTAVSVTFRSRVPTTVGSNINWFAQLITLGMQPVGAGTTVVPVNGGAAPPNPIPEPMTLALVAGALAGLGVFARKRS